MQAHSEIVAQSKKVLVLGGGSLKGAFQAGAILALLETDFVPDALYGVSVGSMNATFLVNETARQFVETGYIDWPKAGHQLIENWIRHITRPEDVATIRSRFRTGYKTIMRRFDGFLDNAPIKSLIHKLVSLDVMRQGPTQLKVGAVDVIGGDMVYADLSDDNFLDYVFASSSLPVLMAAMQIGDKPERAFLDGGLREVAPLREAIDDGATEIVCIACHARRVFNERFNHRNLFNLLDRVKDITVNQLVNNDIAWAERYVAHQKLQGRVIKLTIIRPTEPLYLNLMKFTPDDIGRLIVQGYQAATDVLRAKRIED